MDTSTLELLRALPKAELHVHLEGSMTPERAAALSGRSGTPPLSKEAFVFRSFQDFIRLYLQLSALLRSAEDFRDLVVDLAARYETQNVRYAEVTVTPMTHLTRGVSAARLMAGLSEGRAEARARHGVELRWVLDVVRSFPDQAQPTLDFAMALDHHAPGSVVGLGVGGPEAGTFEMEPIVRMFQAGKAAGFRSLPHAGEMAGPASMWVALETLGADRIGHGVRCLEDPRLVEALCERRIPLEVCPSSNVLLGVVPSLEEHPLPRLMDAGLLVTLASDDPTLFGTDLVREYAVCAETFGWSDDDVRRLTRTSLEVSYMPDALRDALGAADA